MSRSVHDVGPSEPGPFIVGVLDPLIDCPDVELTEQRAEHRGVAEKDVMDLPATPRDKDLGAVALRVDLNEVHSSSLNLVPVMGLAVLASVHRTVIA